MNWKRSHRADMRALGLADRHYNRQKPGTPQFVPPGSCLVLLTEDAGALWVSSRPFPQFVKHQWAGAWMNTMFIRESGPLASDLIREAVALTLGEWGEASPLGMITFIDTDQVRNKRDFGRCYRKAGFRPTGWTKGGLLALQLVPADMPAAQQLPGLQLRLIA